MAKQMIKDLLFHATHGLCRITAIDPDGISCVLSPVAQNHAKARFIVPLKMLPEAGFNKLMSVLEARSVLEYLKSGNKKNSKPGNAWVMAAEICTESASGSDKKDGRARQKIEKNVRSLSSELAYVLEISIEETCRTMLKNLKEISAVHPSVLVAFSKAVNA